MAYFKTLRTLTQNEIEELQSTENTRHIIERENRLQVYNNGSSRLIVGLNIIGAFLVDKDHVNGLERHLIDENGFITVYNHNSKRFITVLSGRPSQIKRYYRDLNMKWGSLVEKAIKIAFERNEKENANNI